MSRKPQYFSFPDGRRRAELGRHAIDSPPPADGEVIRTTLPDTFDGIRFEIGRMAKYVQHYRKDPLVIECARVHAAQYGRFVEHESKKRGKPISAHNNKVIQAEAIDLFCRHYFFYLNDPVNIEVIQTPKRAIKKTKIPREVLEIVMEPYYTAMELEDPSYHRQDYIPTPLYEGDCDEGHLVMLAMCAALEIQPVKFRFGGTGSTLHHVWGSVFADGDWYDSDLTEPNYRLGDFSNFEHYDEYEIPFDEESE